MNYHKNKNSKSIKYKMLLLINLFRKGELYIKILLFRYFLRSD